MKNALGQQIGIRIKALREQKGLTQRELASLIQKSLESVSHFERGKVLTSLVTLERLAEIFEVPIRDFFDQTLPLPTSQTQKSKSATMVLNAVNILPEDDLEIVAGVASMLMARNKRARPKKAIDPEKLKARQEAKVYRDAALRIRKRRKSEI